MADKTEGEVAQEILNSGAESLSIQGHSATHIKPDDLAKYARIKASRSGYLPLALFRIVPGDPRG